MASRGGLRARERRSHSPVSVRLGEAAEHADQVEAGDGEDVVRAVDLVVLRGGAGAAGRQVVRAEQQRLCEPASDPHPLQIPIDAIVARPSVSSHRLHVRWSEAAVLSRHGAARTVPAAYRLTCSFQVFQAAYTAVALDV